MSWQSHVHIVGLWSDTFFPGSNLTVYIDELKTFIWLNLLILQLEYPWGNNLICGWGCMHNDITVNSIINKTMKMESCESRGLPRHFIVGLYDTTMWSLGKMFWKPNNMGKREYIIFINSIIATVKISQEKSGRKCQNSNLLGYGT